MKSNFNSETLLCNVIINIVDNKGGRYKMKLPTLRDKLEDTDFDIFIGFCATSLEEIAKITGQQFKSRFHLFKTYKKNKLDILSILDKFFKKYMIGFKYVDDSLYWGERLVSKEIFETFCDYISIASGVKSIKELDLVITEDMDEYEKKRIELERKIAKTKEKNNQNKKVSSLSNILIGVSKEFHYTYDQLLDMTLYSIYYMYSNIGLIMNYEIGNIAAGNGLLKKGTKHTHWSY